MCAAVPRLLSCVAARPALSWAPSLWGVSNDLFWAQSFVKLPSRVVARSSITTTRMHACTEFVGCQNDLFWAQKPDKNTLSCLCEILHHHHQNARVPQVQGTGVAICPCPASRQGYRFCTGCLHHHQSDRPGHLSLDTCTTSRSVSLFYYIHNKHRVMRSH